VTQVPLNKLLAELNARYPLAFDSLHHLRDGGCVSYIAGSGVNQYLLKLVPEAFLDTARRSADMLLFLESAGFPSPRLLRAVDGAPYAELGGRLLMLFPFIEGREPLLLCYDVLVQYLGTLAVSEGFRPEAVYREVTATHCYQHLSAEDWEAVLFFITSGGQALQQYDECAAILQRELGVAPLPETRAIYQAVMHNEL
jgi:hypothetical protein